MKIKYLAPVAALLLLLAFGGSAQAAVVPYCGYGIKISQGVKQVYIGEISRGRHINELYVRAGWWRWKYWRDAGYHTPTCH